MADAPQQKPSYFLTEVFPREGERGLFDGLALKFLGTDPPESAPNLAKRPAESGRRNLAFLRFRVGFGSELEVAETPGRGGRAGIVWLTWKLKP